MSQAYLEELWFRMHHSTESDRQAMVVTCYLDESATDGGTPTAVVGGLLLNSSHFISLDRKWKNMLDEFHLHPAFHMKDFGEHGRFSDKSATERSEIFSRAVEIIRAHNICTIAATVDHLQYQAIVDKPARKTMSTYALCFIACALGNHTIAEKNGYEERVAFVVDTGNPYSEHVFFAHRDLSFAQDAGHFLNLGSLTLDSDENVTALQAADAVCWSVRRRASVSAFSNGFEPLESILDAKGHNQTPVSEEAMRILLGKTPQ